MGLFDLLKRRKITPINDPVFGVLQYSRGWWSGETFFAPTNTRIQALIKAGEQGPTAAHREFFREVERRYPELIPDIAALLESEVVTVSPSSVTQPGTADFVLDGISLSEDDQQPPKWDLTYGWLQDEEWSFWVNMEGWKVVSLTPSH